MIRRALGRVAWHLRERWRNLCGHDRYQRWILRDLRSRRALIGEHCRIYSRIAEQLLVDHPDRMAALHLAARGREWLLRAHLRIPA